MCLGCATTAVNPGRHNPRSLRKNSAGLVKFSSEIYHPWTASSCDTPLVAWGAVVGSCCTCFIDHGNRTTCRPCRLSGLEAVRCM